MTALLHRGLFPLAATALVAACSGGSSRSPSPFLVTVVQPEARSWNPEVAAVRVLFSRPVADGTFDQDEIALVDEATGNRLAGTVELEDATTLVLKLDRKLEDGRYRANLLGRVRDESRQVSPVPREWTFEVRPSAGTWTPERQIGTGELTRADLVGGDGGHGLAWWTAGDVLTAAAYEPLDGWHGGVEVQRARVGLFADSAGAIGDDGTLALAAVTQDADTGTSGVSASVARPATARERTWTTTELAAPQPVETRAVRAVAAGRTVHVLWVVRDAAGVDRLLTRRTDDGVQWSASEELAAPQGLSIAVQGTATRGDDVLLAWRPSFGSVRVRRYRSGGWQAEETLPRSEGDVVALGHDSDGAPFLLTYEPGAILALWQDRGGSYVARRQAADVALCVGRDAFATVTYDGRSNRPLVTRTTMAGDQETVAMSPRAERPPYAALLGDPDTELLAVVDEDSELRYRRYRTDRPQREGGRWTDVTGYAADFAPVPLRNAKVIGSGSARTFLVWAKDTAITPLSTEPRTVQRFATVLVAGSGMRTPAASITLRRSDAEHYAVAGTTLLVLGSDGAYLLGSALRER